MKMILLNYKKSQENSTKYKSFLKKAKKDQILLIQIYGSAETLKKIMSKN